MWHDPFQRVTFLLSHIWHIHDKTYFTLTHAESRSHAQNLVLTRRISLSYTKLLSLSPSPPNTHTLSHTHKRARAHTHTHKRANQRSKATSSGKLKETYKKDHKRHTKVKSDLQTKRDPRGFFSLVASFRNLMCSWIFIRSLLRIGFPIIHSNEPFFLYKLSHSLTNTHSISPPPSPTHTHTDENESKIESDELLSWLLHVQVHTT